MIGWMADGVCMKISLYLRLNTNRLISPFELEGHHGRAPLHGAGGDKASWC